MAATDREVVEGAATEGPAAAGEANPAKPDLDTLARQVYSILKRRLEGERRRSL
jgi:hypothetical protein